MKNQSPSLSDKILASLQHTQMDTEAFTQMLYRFKDDTFASYQVLRKELVLMIKRLRNYLDDTHDYSFDSIIKMRKSLDALEKEVIAGKHDKSKGEIELRLANYCHHLYQLQKLLKEEKFQSEHWLTMHFNIQSLAVKMFILGLFYFSDKKTFEQQWDGWQKKFDAKIAYIQSKIAEGREDIDSFWHYIINESEHLRACVARSFFQNNSRT